MGPEGDTGHLHWMFPCLLLLKLCLDHLNGTIYVFLCLTNVGLAVLAYLSPCEMGNIL